MMSHYRLTVTGNREMETFLGQVADFVDRAARGPLFPQLFFPLPTY